MATPASSSDNLLLNPGFEADADGDSSPDGWTANNHFTRSAAAVHGGSYAGRWRSGSNGGGSSYQQIRGSAGTTYTVSGWVNAPARRDAFTFQVKLLWRSPSGAIGTTVVKTYRDDTGGAWQSFAASASAPVGTTMVRLQLTTGSLKGTIYVDDMLLAAAATEPSSATASPSPTATPDTGQPAVLVGAGDIGNCNTTTDEATARLLDEIPGTVFTAGDNAYGDGTSANFAECYAPTWGRHQARTRPAPGNHDYHTAGAAAYFAYFGSNAGPAGLGYYAYSLGTWRVYSLNSELVSSEQTTWLINDLAANPSDCVAAYYHHPRYATPDANGSHGSQTDSEPLWDALADAGADLVLNGHSHHYERLAPIRGITEVIVGTGGTKMNGFGSPIAESEVRQSTAHGVLKVTLNPGGYTAEFVPIAGQTFTDAFSGSCSTGIQSARTPMMARHRGR